MNRLTVIVIFFFVQGVTLMAQSVTGEVEMQNEIAALTGLDDAGNIAERLSYLAEQPVKINSGKEEEIARLFFLSEFQVKVLADYVMKKGAIVSLYEIALLPGFDRATAMMMDPYISLEAFQKLSFPGGGATTAIVSLMLKASSAEEDSVGLRSVMRLRHSGRTFSCGMTVENDPGESFSFNNQVGADFLSAHLMYQGESFVSRVIVGDYSLRFGEGLLFNNSSWQGGWLSSPSFMAGRAMLSPYTSTDENNFFRGAAAVLGSLTDGAVVFISSNKIDGRIKLSESDSTSYVSNLVTGGLHNTTSGIEARNTLTENIAGLHYTTGGEKIRAGATVSATFFSLPLIHDTTDGANLYTFEGDRLFNLGADLKAYLGKIILYGEGGYSDPGSWAGLMGMRAIPSGRMTVNLLTRYLSPKYHSFHSGVYGAGSSSSNEWGIAGNIHFEAARHFFLTTGVDIYKHPWLSYRSTSPSAGARTDIRAEYTPSESFTCRVGWSLLQREYDVTDDTGIPVAEEVKRRQLSFLAAWSPVKAMTLTSRAVWCRVPEEEEEGYLLCQDVLWSPGALPLRLWLRYSLFTTSGWDSRIYIYENDLLHTVNMPALYGDGSRTYIMVEWDITKKLMFRLKYGLTVSDFDNVRTTINEGRVQVKMMF